MDVKAVASFRQKFVGDRREKMRLESAGGVFGVGEVGSLASFGSGRTGGYSNEVADGVARMERSQ